MEVRQQIKDGTYLTGDKLDSALDRAMDEALKNYNPYQQYRYINS